MTPVRGTFIGNNGFLHNFVHLDFYFVNLILFSKLPITCINRLQWGKPTAWGSSNDVSIVVLDVNISSNCCRHYSKNCWREVHTFRQWTESKASVWCSKVEDLPLFSFHLTISSEILQNVWHYTNSTTCAISSQYNLAHEHFNVIISIIGPGRRRDHLEYLVANMIDATEYPVFDIYHSVCDIPVFGVLK